VFVAPKAEVKKCTTSQSHTALWFGFSSLVKAKKLQDVYTFMKQQNLPLKMRRATFSRVPQDYEVTGSNRSYKSAATKNAKMHSKNILVKILRFVSFYMKMIFLG